MKKIITMLVLVVMGLSFNLYAQANNEQLNTMLEVLIKDKIEDGEYKKINSFLRHYPESLNNETSIALLRSLQEHSNIIDLRIYDDKDYSEFEQGKALNLFDVIVDTQRVDFGKYESNGGESLFNTCILKMDIEQDSSLPLYLTKYLEKYFQYNKYLEKNANEKINEEAMVKILLLSTKESSMENLVLMVLFFTDYDLSLIDTNKYDDKESLEEAISFIIDLAPKDNLRNEIKDSIRKK